MARHRQHEVAGVPTRRDRSVAGRRHGRIGDGPRRRATAVAVRVVALALAGAAAARADDALRPYDDPVLAALIAESLHARHEIHQAEALVQAERERVPQAGALPDPVLGLGIQNDSFNRIEIGRAETSFWQVVVSQGLPFPGKRGLRTDIADLAARQAETVTGRVRLSTEAEVRRAYLDLLLARDRLRLLDRLEGIWQQAAGIAETRYGTGEGTQPDILRAQVERGRIQQRRALLRGEEQARVQVLNRLRAHALDDPIVSPATLRDVRVPPIADAESAVADALARSPELAQARLGVEQAHKRLELSERDRYPDFGVNLGVMPRGSLEPMWTVGFSVGLPVWLDRKQNRAVAEDASRAEADAAGAATIEQVIRLRVAERRIALAALLETVRLYRQGLLVRSQATVESTLAQYRVGRLPFVAVLEANAGYVNDEDGHLVALADVERIVIAAAEVSLDPVAFGSAGAAGMAASAGPAGAGGVPMSGGAPASARETSQGGAPGAPGM